MPSWKERAEKVLIDGCCTFSKRVQSYIEGVTDSHVESAHGLYLTLTSRDDPTHLKEVLDTVSGLGSNLWECSNNFSLEHRSSVVLAEMLIERMPYHDKVKFVKSGSESCQAAIRYARAFTKRPNIAYTGYHGFHSVFTSCTPPALGCSYEHCQKFEDIDRLITFVECRPHIAAVIIEPLELELDDMVDRLRRLQSACAVDGCLLIYDEVITGWRVPQFTIGNWTEIHPDISCLGKAIGGGHPLGIVAIKDQYITPGVFISSTFGGELSTIETAIQTIIKTTPQSIKSAWVLGEEFQHAVNQIKPEWLRLKGYPTRFVWQAEDTIKALIWQELYRRGILAGAAFFPKLSWTKDNFDWILINIKKAMHDIENNVCKLEGIPPQPVFKRV